MKRTLKQKFEQKDRKTYDFVKFVKSCGFEKNFCLANIFKTTNMQISRNMDEHKRQRGKNNKKVPILVKDN